MPLSKNGEPRNEQIAWLTFYTVIRNTVITVITYSYIYTAMGVSSQLRECVGHRRYEMIDSQRGA